LDLQAAQNFWEEALRIDPRFEPAREGLVVVNKSIRVEERILGMQHLYF